MGWYQDNFPGSPAARQRTLISRGLILYCLLTGGAIYFFSPLCRRLRKELDEGRVPDDFVWLRERQEGRKLENKNLIYSQPTLEEFMKAQQNYAREHRSDFSGPDVPTETIRTFGGKGS